MDITVIEVTGNEPVTLEQAKQHLRITTSEDDAYIQSLIALGREYCDFTGRSFVEKTVELTLETFPHAGFSLELHAPPLLDVEYVKYKDQAGIEQTLIKEDDYIVIHTIYPGVILPPFDHLWPQDLCDRPDDVSIRYTTGAYVPLMVDRAILLFVGHYYENRELSSEKKMTEIPMGVHNLLWPHRIMQF